jgi:hypothetical protein
VFPEKYVYQWFGIIMKNVATLRATTMLAGHDTYYDMQPILDFAQNLLGSDNVDEEYTLDNEGEIRIRLNKTQLETLLRGDVGKTLLQQGGAEPYDASEYDDEVQYFNDKMSYMGELEIGDDGVWWTLDATDFLDYLGFFEWCNFPDGSDAYSDFGLAPLEKIISEYREGMGAAQVLVLINKALDVTHCRGDLSSIFIEGGRNTLDNISESREIKKIIVSEDQIPTLLKGRMNGNG